MHILLSQSSGREIKSRKKLQAERKITKLETVQGKLENLTITVKNDKSSSPRKQSPTKKPRNNEDKGLFDQLRQLQQGMIQSDSLLLAAKQKPASTSNSSSPSNVNKSKRDEQKNRRQEITETCREIQLKISNQIKPRLIDIINNKGSSVRKNGIIDKKSPAVARFPQSNVKRDFAIKKTALSTGIEIYRYSFEELFCLEQHSTWELVPRLLQLDICRTPLTDEKMLILSLLKLSNDERQAMILKQAEKMNFIKRTSGNDYSFMPTNCYANEKFSPQPQLPVKQEEIVIDEIERLKMTVNNSKELNQLIYQHEFNNLFGSDLNNLQDQSHEQIVQYLLDNNKAFIVDGEIRVNQKNNNEAYVSQLKGLKDICINRLILRKFAFHGDWVRVLVKRDNDEIIENPDELNDDSGAQNLCRSYGCVLEILQTKHSRRVIGTFAPFLNIKKNRKHLMVVVRDTKVPNIRVCTRTGLPTDIELNDNLLLSVEIIDWIHDQPQGKIVGILGKKGQLKTENAAILQQNNLDPLPFDKSILEKLPTEPYVIPESEFNYRLDLRKKCIFSIDPESARDLDDALSCEVLPNGNLEIGVHISDVSFFVKENSELDMIVKDKATTIYLVDAVYHMLPEQLCLLCSLLPGADKLAYSVIYEINPNTAEIYSTRFTRSVVNSCGKLSYDHAQMVIEKKNRNWEELESEFPEILNGFTVANIAEIILKLQNLAIIMRATRKENGALKIDQPKLAFKFEKDDNRMEAPVNFYKYRTRDSNRLIEEFMLLANISVATFINEKYPKISLLRHHAEPNENGMKKLAKNLMKHGIALDTSSSKAISKSMENIVAFAKHPSAMNAALNLLVSRTMTRANYFCSGMAEKAEDYRHYALSIPIYTHFTSPIRRYADILVHRVLNTALDYDQAPSRTSDEIQMNATVCNAQKYAAKLAGDDSTNLYFMHFIQKLGCTTMSAAVLGIYDYNLEIVLIDSAHLIKVYYKVIITH